MRTRTPIDRWDLSIRKQDRVLEVGSGHNPFYRSNVIVDKYVNDNTQRCTSLGNKNSPIRLGVSM